MTPSNQIPAVCNYGTSAVYSDYPSPEQMRAGVVPLDSLPAAWWNKMWCASNCAINEARDMVGQIITEVNNVLCQAGINPQAACTDQLYQSINKIRQTLATASVPGAVVSSSVASEVAVDPTTGRMTVNCLGNAASLTTSAHTIVGAINELKSTYDCCFSDTATALNGKAPTSHASSATTYGVGSADNYGHLKISDTYTSVLAACSGVAASQMALACVYAVAAAAAAGNVSLGNTVGCALGTAAAGTAITAARSDHVHPIPSMIQNTVSDGTYCAWMACGNTLNITPSNLNNSWINYTGGSSETWIGDGTGRSTLGTLCANTLYGNHCGLSQCAYYVFHDSFFGDANRNVMIANESGANIYGCIGTSQNCPLTFNPATGTLTADRFNGTASQAGKSYCVGDFTQPSTNIFLGYANAGLSCDQVTHLAAFSTNYSNGKIVIKDASKAVIQSWLGLGSAAYRNESDLCVSYAQCAYCADRACWASGSGGACYARCHCYYTNCLRVFTDGDYCRCWGNMFLCNFSDVAVRLFIPAVLNASCSETPDIMRNWPACIDSYMLSTYFNFSCGADLYCLLKDERVTIPAHAKYCFYIGQLSDIVCIPTIAYY